MRPLRLVNRLEYWPARARIAETSGPITLWDETGHAYDSCSGCADDPEAVAPGEHRVVFRVFHVSTHLWLTLRGCE
jgi:hypothetical protein